MSQNAIYIIDTEPLIIHAYTWRHVLNPMWTFGHLLKGVQTFFLVSLSWSLLDPERFKNMLVHYHLYKNEYPEHEILILCNEKEEAVLLKKFNIPAIFANHNALLDYNVYKYSVSDEKKYDAVLNSRLDRWKRHILAKKVSPLALITYGFLDTPEEKSYLKYLKRTFVQADFVNYDSADVYHWLSDEQVSSIYAQSQVGLILSAVEGACFASCEYLLAGLPVVSTENIGGRNLFLDPEFCRIVEPSQLNIKTAVDDLKSLNLDPAYIRQATIANIEKYRAGFLEAWQLIYDTLGVRKSSKELWPGKFRNKMAIAMSDSEAVKYLGEAINQV